VQEIQNGLAELNATNFYLARQSFLSYLAEGQALTGSVADALATVEQALQANPEELLYRPEVFRLRGELKLKSEAEGKAQIEPAQQTFAQLSNCRRRWERNLMSFARRPVWRAYSRTKVIAMKRVRCSPKSMAGSPRALTPPTSRTPKPC
jgi:hypothetical protein